MDDRRLIEDYLPIEAISAEASREKSVRKGHISTLHLWWARRPLVACRAAVYGALVPASRFVPNGRSDEQKKSLGRANAARFVKALCRYPSGSKPEEKASIERTIHEAQRHILAAHADRLTAELTDGKARRTEKPGWVDEFKWKGEKVTVEDIVAGRAPRPRVLDMFAGGGAIPLEALRLGCEAYANDLNPVAHIIQLCTLVYPQKFGKPDPTARGMTGPPLECGATVPVAEDDVKRDACPTFPDLLAQTVYFNPHEPLGISERRLPHWRQTGDTYFVTFRLADALPQRKLDELAIERDSWLKTHMEPFTEETRREYFRLFSERVQEWLDAGEGECLMKDPKLAADVANALQHFDGQRYNLSAWVVMPNHVHALVTPRPGWELEQILHSWKSFTAHEINKRLRRNGQVWQHEGYDHIVRNPKALWKIAAYIADNPLRARVLTSFVENRLDPSGKGVALDNARENRKRDACATMRSWGGLADEVRYWGNWVLKKVKAEIGDLYPLIPDPDYKGKRPPIEIDPETGDWIVSRPSTGSGQAKGGKAKDDPFAPPQGVMDFAEDAQLRLSPTTDNRSPTTDLPPGYLMPVAYLWTRTVKCKNPTCGATVPLVKQTWLCKKDGRYVAMKMVAPKGKKEVRFEVVEARTEKGLGFDPEAFSEAGNATCPFCKTVADADYVQAEGCAQRVGTQIMAVACTRSGGKGKTYLSACEVPGAAPDEADVHRRIKELCRVTGLTVPNEPISPLRPSPNARGLSGLTRHGITDFGALFLSRQQLLLLTACHAAIRASEQSPYGDPMAACLGLLVGRVANQNCAFGAYHTGGEKIEGPMGDKKVPMVWDFPETNPLSGKTGGVDNAIGWIVDVLSVLRQDTPIAHVHRGDATVPRFAAGSFTAVITDPPYYDNVPYADISDFFYVWLKRTVSRRFPEHFTSALSPKKSELTALSSRFDGDMKKATASYESGMFAAFQEANRVLVPKGIMAVIYAHKTTLGWSTLVNALRSSGFEVTEAWPLATEMPGGKVKVDKAMLASSIFLVARKRDAASKAGNYEKDVVPDLGSIVRERVDTLWDMGISGADLVIACVGAGLRAFTKYPRVEFANGEEVPAERFLMEVETVVLEAILGKLSKTVGAKAGETLSGLDPATRFYVLWRYTYGGGELNAGEAIIFANGTHVELDGQHSLTAGARALLEKKKGKYKLLDFTERGDDENLGLADGKGGATVPVADGKRDTCPTIDALHRLMWLVEHKPPKIPDFLNEAKPNVEQLRLVAQALAGPALKGGELADVSPTAEQSALGKLLANWNAVMVGKTAVSDRRAGQQQLL